MLFTDHTWQFPLQLRAQGCPGVVTTRGWMLSTRSEPSGMRPRPMQPAPSLDQAQPSQPPPSGVHMRPPGHPAGPRAPGVFPKSAAGPGQWPLFCGTTLFVILNRRKELHGLPLTR